MDEHELPRDIMLEIFSRIPIKSLARCKCVSKQWCTFIDNPYLAIMHTEEPVPLQIRISPSVSVFVRGSCYGLLLLQIQQLQPYYHTSYIVFHPLRKEIYELPPMETSLILSPPQRETLGLGFDHSTNTFKIVKVLLLTDLLIMDLDLVRQNLRTMVHVLGTRSWREIPNVPSHPLILSDEAIFAHGFLYWITSASDVQNGKSKVVCFDVTKEEFGSINPPEKRREYSIFDIKLFDLNDDLGVAYYDNNVIEVWVMKEKVWKIHCQIDRKSPFTGLDNYFVGVWNKRGDILVGFGQRSYFVFGLITAIRRFNVDGYFDMVHMYTPSLFSINGITRNPNNDGALFKKYSLRPRWFAIFDLARNFM